MTCPIFMFYWHADSSIAKTLQRRQGVDIEIAISLHTAQAAARSVQECLQLSSEGGQWMHSLKTYRQTVPRLWQRMHGHPRLIV